MKNTKLLITFFIIIASYVVLCSTKVISWAPQIFPNVLFKEIKIDPGKYEKVLLSDIADSFWLIPLDSNPEGMFSIATKVLISDDKIFISDSQNSQMLFCFSISGKFLFNIDRLGRGPGEYGEITDFTLDKQNKKIIIADRDNNAVLLFDYSGKYLKTIKCELYFDYLAHLSGTRLLLMTDHSTNDNLPENKQYQALVYDYEANKVLKGFIEFDGESNRVMNIKGIFNNISENSLAPVFYVTGTRSLWALNDETLINFVNISFGKKNLPDDFLDKQDYFAQEKYYKEGTYIYGLENFQVVGNWIVGCYDYMKETPTFFFNYKTGKLYNTNSLITNDLGSFPLVAFPLFHTDGENLISVIPPSFILKFIENPLSKLYFPENLRNFTEDDNAVIQIIKLKQ